jgi:hypothetical protein
MQSWAEQQGDLTRLAAGQLFFIGGAPRSGTTWLQQMLGSHPDVCCRGEGLLRQGLADPLAALMTQRRASLEAKNTQLFRHTGGFALPTAEDGEGLLGTAILQALHRQCEGHLYRAVGEKTPENAFFFPRLKALFPRAKFIGIARDPRDVLTSAWHFFRAGTNGASHDAAKTAFIRDALPSLDQGGRSMLELVRCNPADCVIVTYEALLHAPGPVLAHLFRLLDVTDDPAVVAQCIARTNFTTVTGGRPAGVKQDGSFFRKGVAGGWDDTLTPAMNTLVLDALGWMFPRFGWTP